MAPIPQREGRAGFEQCDAGAWPERGASSGRTSRRIPESEHRVLQIIDFHFLRLRRSLASRGVKVRVHAGKICRRLIS